MNGARVCLVVALAASVAGCGAGALDPPWPSHRDSYLLRGERRSLELFTGLSERVEAAVLRIQPTATAEQLGALRRSCGDRVDPGVADKALFPLAAAPLAAAALGGAITFVGGEAKRAVDEWASSFEAQWSGRYTGHFYAAPPEPNAPGRLSDVRFTGRCFALERRVEGDRTVFLFVGRFDRSDDGFALRITPLFTRHTGTKARLGSGGRFVSAMTLTIDAVWGDARSGVAATRNTVLTSTMDFGEAALGMAGGDGFLSADASAATASTWFPFVPVSREADGRLTGRGPVTITATVTETAIARDLAGAAARSAGKLIDEGVQAGVGRVEGRDGARGP